MFERLKIFKKNVKEQLELIQFSKRKTVPIETSTTTTGYQRPLENLELLYKTDALIFSLVNKLTLRIMGEGFEFIASDDKSYELEKALNEWIKEFDISLEVIITDLIRNAIIFGDAYAEIVLNDSETDIADIIVLDPKTIDYQRDEKGDIIFDENQEPVGYEQKLYSITQNSVKLPRDSVLHIQIIPSPDGFTGISLVNVAYKMSVIRMNIEEAIGESAFRFSFPLIVGKYGDAENPPSREAIKKFFDAISDITNKSAIALPYYADIKRLDPNTGIRDLRDNASYFTDLLCATFLTPRALLLPTSQINYAGLMAQEEDFAKDISAIRNVVARQIIQQLVDKFKKVRNISGNVRIDWKEISDNIKLSRARRLATYARTGLITPDLETENYLRKLENLPKKTEYKKDEG